MPLNSITTSIQYPHLHTPLPTYPLIHTHNPQTFFSGCCSFVDALDLPLCKWKKAPHKFLLSFIQQFYCASRSALQNQKLFLFVKVQKSFIQSSKIQFFFNESSVKKQGKRKIFFFLCNWFFFLRHNEGRQQIMRQLRLKSTN